MGNQAQLQEFDHEMGATRKVLERIPDEKLDWRPHEKSRTTAQLAEHIANLAGFPVQIVEKDSLDIAPPQKVPSTKPLPISQREILSKFDSNVSAARVALAKLTPESLKQPWILSSGGKTLVSLPRGAMLRVMGLSHLIHHRAQLGVYLRLNNVAVPAVYGPSADEDSA